MNRNGTNSQKMPPDATPGEEERFLSSAQMDRLEDWFSAQRANARQPKQTLARTRIWIVFLLIRYCGLRLGEALQLDDRHDIQLAGARISIPGTYARDIPMPLPLLVRLQKLQDDPALSTVRGRLTHLDQGYVRRCFYACAENCGIAPGMAAPRVIRQSRGNELIRKSLPLPLVELFLGTGKSRQSKQLGAYTEKESAERLWNHLHRENILKTSARNVFAGRIASIRQSGFLVEVVVKTLSGLEVVAIITEDSLHSLELFAGKPIVATIKAPWVTLTLLENRHTAGKNFFPGEVTRVQTSDLAAEYVVRLEDGSHMCSLAVTGGEPALGIQPGNKVGVSFKAFAVVLAAAPQ